MVAGLHGNEKLSLNIAREVSESLDPRQLHGVVLLVPEASATAIRDATRDVPGSGDLNRAFPGDPKGDGAHQIAYALFREVVSRSDFGIDLHAAPEGRLTLPHLRGNLDNPHVRRLCDAFGSNLILDSPGPPHSLRRVATEFGVPTITIETGGLGRGEKAAVQDTLKGIVGVMSTLRMLGGDVPWRGSPTLVRDARWLTAPRGGRLEVLAQPGATMRSGDVIARVEGESISAPRGSLVISVSSARTVAVDDPICEIATPVEDEHPRNAVPPA
jgi:predicted deacylase